MLPGFPNTPTPRFRLTLLLVLCLFFSSRLLAQIGGIDVSYQSGAFLNGANVGTVRAQALDSTGRSIIAGDFTSVGGINRGRIARLGNQGALDGTFATGAGANGPINAVAIDSSGNILIGGEFTSYDGVARNRIARLTPLGNLDTTFNPGTGVNGPVYALASYSTSLVYIGGIFSNVNGVPVGNIAQLNSSGSVGSIFSGGANGAVRVITTDSFASVIYLGGDFTTISGSSRKYFAQVDRYGYIYTSSPSFNAPVRAIALSSNFPSPSSSGRLLVGGDFTTVDGVQRARLAAFNVSTGLVVFDGTLNFYLDSTCRQIIAASSSRFFFAGDFTTINGQSRNRLAGISLLTNSSGSTSSSYWDLDAGYGGDGPDTSILSLQRTSDGRPLIGGTFSTFAGQPITSFLRLYNDAGGQPPLPPSSPVALTLSDTQIRVSWSASAYATKYSLEASSSGSGGWTEIYNGSFTYFREENLAAGVQRFYRLRASSPDGTSAYTAIFSTATSPAPWAGSGSVLASQPSWALDGSVSSLLRQPDGKIVLAGNFTSILGTTRPRIARLLPDLTLDPTFNPGTGPNSNVSQLALAPDGRIYLFGTFTQVSGSTRNAIARLNVDGSLDTSFDTQTSWTFATGIRVQSDGKLIVYGAFQTFFGAPGNYLVRLDQTGGKDNTFSVTANSQLQALDLQPDGKLVFSGYFSSLNSTSTSYFARVDSTGALDSSFVGKATSPNINFISALRTGQHFVSGSFTTVSNTTRKYLARLNANGDIDTTFDPGTSTNASDLSLFSQPDGRIILAGSFTTSAGVTRWKITRLNAKGSLDTAFTAEAGPGEQTINAVLTLPDNNLLVGGTFTSFGATSRAYLVGLRGDINNIAPGTPANLSSQTLSRSSIRLGWDQLPNEYSWQLERSAAGASQWQPIASLDFDTTSFTDNALATATSYDYRLRATNSAGVSPYSAVAIVSTFTNYQQWKLDAGFSANTPDNSDSDGDGFGLLLEYALGSNPADALSIPFLSGQIVGNSLILSYNKLRSELLYSVETSTDLQTWSSDGVNQGTGAWPIAFKTIASTSPQFLRLRVSFLP